MCLCNGSYKTTSRIDAKVGTHTDGVTVFGVIHFRTPVTRDMGVTMYFKWHFLVLILVEIFEFGYKSHKEACILNGIFYTLAGSRANRINVHMYA